jgi:hypothetical protein
VGKLGVAPDPMERLKLASTIWKSITTLPRAEQKAAMLELGIQEAAQLKDILSRDAVSAAPLLLRLLDQRFPNLKPGRLVGHLVRPPEPPPDIPEVDDFQGPGEQPDSLAGPAGGLVPDSLSAERDSEREEEAEWEESSESDEVLRQDDPMPVPASATTLRPFPPEPPVRRETHLPAPPESSSKDRSGIPREDLIRRLCELNSNWERRRLLIDWLRRGRFESEPKALVRLTAEAGLSPQSYVWVLGEMAALDLLDPESVEVAIELAPNPSAEALLRRRLSRFS